jgi:hypothetical protein
LTAYQKRKEMPASTSARSVGGRRVANSKKSVPFWKKIGFDAPPKGFDPVIALGSLNALTNADGGATPKTYKQLTQYELENGIPAGKMVNFVRHAGCLKTKFAMEGVNTSADNGTFHAWIRRPDGTIYDPHFEEYEDLAEMPNCDALQKVYHEWSPAQQKEKLTNSIPRIMRNIRANMEANGMTMREIAEVFCERPGFRSCIINAYCYKLIHPDSEIVIGHMGFRNKKTPEIVWWEY